MSTAGELRQKDALDRARQSPACKRGLATFSFARVARQRYLTQSVLAPRRQPFLACEDAEAWQSVINVVPHTRTQCL
jgi:hypothetical protein